MIEAPKSRRPWHAVAVSLLLCTLISYISSSSSAQSRPWKPKLSGLALDYSQIIDDRGNGEFVLTWWLVPQIVVNSPDAQLILEKYVVVGVVHGHTESNFVVKFDPIDSLNAQDGNANPLTLLVGDAIPPNVTGMLAGVEATMRQALGATGEGMHWFVFDGTTIHSCIKGGLSIPVAGVTYTYETPIPGCP